jgi:hypothetical protein
MLGGEGDRFAHGSAWLGDGRVRNVVRLVDDLVDVARITQGKLTLQLAPSSSPAFSAGLSGWSIATSSDDNADAAEGLTALLQVYGHDARLVHDGLAALELVPSFFPPSSSSTSGCWAWTATRWPTVAPDARG